MGTINMIEEERVVTVGDAEVTQSLANEKANGKEFADALLTLGVNAPETETAVNNIITHLHVLANAADDPDIIGIAGNQRDYWRVWFDKKNGINVQEAYFVNWSGFTLERMIELYGIWSEENTPRSTINWIGANNITS